MLFWFPTKKHSIKNTLLFFPKLLEEKEEEEEERPRARMKRRVLGVIKPRDARERCDDGRVGAKSDVVRARVDESAKDDDAFENREAKSRNELDEKDYTTAWKEEDRRRMMRYDREDWEEYETTEDILRRDEDLELLVRDLTMEEEEDDGR